MRKVWMFLSILIVIMLLTACAPSQHTKVKLAEVTRSVFYTPQYVAIEKGFFEEEDIEIELTTTWGGDKTMTALLSDNADIALIGAETSIYVYGQEATDPIINFAQLTKTDGTFLVAKKANEAFSWEDVKGTEFLGQRVGGMPQMVGEHVLKKHDIDPHKDLDLKQNIDFANIPSAFVSTDADYVQLFEPTASTFEKEGKGYVLASFGEESGELPYTVFMTKASFLNEEEDVVKRFTKAIYKAQQWVQATDTEEVAKVVQPYFEDTEVDMLAASIERYKAQGSFAETPLLSEDGWELLQEVMQEAGELKREAPYSDLVNTTIAEDVMND